MLPSGYYRKYAKCKEGKSCRESCLVIMAKIKFNFIFSHKVKYGSVKEWAATEVSSSEKYYVK